VQLIKTNVNNFKHKSRSRTARGCLLLESRTCKQTKDNLQQAGVVEHLDDFADGSEFLDWDVEPKVEG
jgi:hypothetical protein